MDNKFSADELSNWRANPTTHKWFQFIKDYRQQVANEIAARIFNGDTLEKEIIDGAAMRCEILQDIDAMTSDDLNKFYNADPQQGGIDNEPSADAEKRDN